MSVSSVLFTVHFEWGTDLGPKMFYTSKLKELQCHKTRRKQSLVGATSMPNFMQICWEVLEK